MEDNFKVFEVRYRVIDKDYFLRVKASSLNDAMVKFSTHYLFIDEVYSFKIVQ